MGANSQNIRILKMHTKKWRKTKQKIAVYVDEKYNMHIKGVNIKFL